MKKKRISKLLIGAGLIFTLGLAPLTSCSTFFGEDGFTITNVTWNENNDGGITVVMQTTREENPNITFTIPKGNEGVGIKSVTPIVDEDNRNVTITIKYTDPKVQDTVITFPIVHGEDGRGILQVEVTNEEEGVKLHFTYTDKTTQDILIPNGKDGNGIADFKVDETSNPNFIIVTIKFTDASIKPKEIKIPKGQNGISITSVEFVSSKETDKDYVLKVVYSDGFEQEIIIPKPKATVWHHGESTPADLTGNNGDYYLNVLSGFVYYKENGKWKFIFSMDGSGSYIEKNVVFHQGEGTWVNPPYRDGEVVTITLKYGGYISLEDFPIVERTGYTFTGWFTGNENEVNAGQFTDLTPVQRNMDLYPRWIVK